MEQEHTAAPTSQDPEVWTWNASTGEVRDRHDLLVAGEVWSESDADKIIATPNLIAALELAREYLRTTAHDENHLVLQRINAALDKTRGGV